MSITRAIEGTIVVSIWIVAVSFAPACGTTPTSRNGSEPMSKTPGISGLTKEEALRIVEKDVLHTYDARDLAAYHVRATLESDGWHIDYDLKDKQLEGGGPHYVIDRHSGAILSRRHEQ
jgi:hypothetical protein